MCPRPLLSRVDWNEDAFREPQVSAGTHPLWCCVPCSLALAADTCWREQADREVDKIVDKRKVMPGVTVGRVEKVTEGADALFDDEEERACQLLALRGCSPAVCKAICAGELASGCPPKGLFDHIKCMEDQLLQSTIQRVTAQVAAEAAADAQLEKASELMLAGDYAGALKIYDDVLAAHPTNEEATRGTVEAKKGQRFLAMVENGSDGDMLAMMMGDLGDDDGDVEIPSMPPPTETTPLETADKLAAVQEEGKQMMSGWTPQPEPSLFAPQGEGLPPSPFSRDGSHPTQAVPAATSAPATPALLQSAAQSPAPALAPAQAPVFGDPTTYTQQAAAVASPAPGSAAGILSQQRSLLQQTGGSSASTAAAGAM